MNRTHTSKEYFENNKKCVGNALTNDKKVRLTNAMIDTYYTKSQLGNSASYNSNRALEALKKFKTKFEDAKQQEEKRRNLFTSMTKTNSTYVTDHLNAQNNAEQNIKQLKREADIRINEIDTDISKYVESRTTSDIPNKIRKTLKDETTRQLSLIEPPKPLDFSGSFTQKENEYDWTIGDNNTIIRIDPITRQLQCIATTAKDKCATDRTINSIKRMENKDIPILSCDTANYNDVNHWCYSSYKKLTTKYDNIIDYTNCPIDWELNNAKQCIPRAGTPIARLNNIIENKSTIVFHNNKLYRSLSENWEYDGTAMVCQTDYLSLPTGWIIAPNDDDSKYIISNYRWSTAVMVVNDGASYWTNLWGDRQLRLYSNGMLSNISNTRYKPNVCNGGILIIKNKQQSISSIPLNDTINNKRDYMKEYSNIRFPFKINIANDVSSVINKALDEKLGSITSKKTINVNLDKFIFYRNGVLARTFAYTPSNGRGAKISEEITTSSINYSWNNTIDKIFNIPRTQNIFIEFTGYIFIPEQTTSLTFHITANTSMKFSLAMDGKVENMRQLNSEFLSDFTTDTIAVQEKQYLPFIIEYYQIGGTSNPSIRLEWTLNNSTSEIVPRAVYYLDKTQCSSSKIDVPKFSRAIGKKEIDAISGLPAGIVGWYDGDSFETKTNRWLDKSGNSNHITDCFGQINIIVSGGNGSTETKYLTGDTKSGVTLPSPVVWNGSKYTFFHITRYAGNTNGRIWSGTTGNWLSGHWANRGVAFHHDGWMSGGGRWSYEGMINGKDWTLITDQSTYARANRAAYQFWGGNGTIPQNISINKSSASNELSDWACAEVIIYQRELSVAEIEVVESFLYTKNKLSV
jgi:hypothetical protein